MKIIKYQCDFCGKIINSKIERSDMAEQKQLYILYARECCIDCLKDAEEYLKHRGPLRALRK